MYNKLIKKFEYNNLKFGIGDWGLGPKNENQAKKLENKISGFVSEFEKPKDELTEKILSTKIY